MFQQFRKTPTEQPLANPEFATEEEVEDLMAKGNLGSLRAMYTLQLIATECEKGYIREKALEALQMLGCKAIPFLWEIEKDTRQSLERKRIILGHIRDLYAQLNAWFISIHSSNILKELHTFATAPHKHNHDPCEKLQALLPTYQELTGVIEELEQINETSEGTEDEEDEILGNLTETDVEIAKVIAQASNNMYVVPVEKLKSRLPGFLNLTPKEFLLPLPPNHSFGNIHFDLLTQYVIMILGVLSKQFSEEFLTLLSKRHLEAVTAEQCQTNVLLNVLSRIDNGPNWYHISADTYPGDKIARILFNTEEKMHPFVKDVILAVLLREERVTQHVSDKLLEILDEYAGRLI